MDEITQFEKKEFNGDVVPNYEIRCSFCGLKSIIPVEIFDAVSGLRCSFCGHKFKLR